MSTSDGVPARTPGFATLRKAILAGVSCLLVFGSGASAKNGRHKAPGAKRAAAAVQPAPRVYRGAEVLGVFPAREIAVDMSKLPQPKAWRPGDPIKEIPKRSKARPGKTDPEAQAAARAQTAGSDPLRAAQDQAKGGRTSRAFPTATLNFAGQDFTGVNPPDTVGDVGVDYYIQMVNGGTVVSIYNKTDGSLAQSFNLESLWPVPGQPCANGLGDPVVLYDRLAGRWFLSEFSASFNRICMYVSQTSDPTNGLWYGYEIAASSFPDYPKYAAWPDAYYISSNQTASTAYAIDRTAMLNGEPATFVEFTVPDLAGFSFQALQAANVLGFQAPPLGAPGIFMRHRDDEAHNAGSNNPAEDYLELWEFSVDFATPDNSTFTGPITIPIMEIDSELCGFVAFECFPQPDSSTGLDPLREVIMFPLVYRNFGSHETLVGNLVTDVDGNDTGGIRWFELRRSAGGNWTLFQEGTYSPDNDSRFMGSIAMDNAGNIAVGYNVSSTTTFPSLRYAGRLAGDPLGTLPQGEYSIVEGAGSNASNRYGDYSAMSLDPVDDCTFWFTGEFNPTANGQWATQIASFRFDACGEPGFALSVDPPNPQVCAPGPVEPITLNVASISEFNGNVTLSLSLPTGITGDVSPNPASAPGSAGISLTADDTAAPGNNVVDVFGTSPGADDRQTSIVVEVATAVPAAPALLTPGDSETGTISSPLLSWSDTGADQYLVEVATDPGFTSIVDSATVTGTSYTASGLAAQTTYYWRVRGSNICGEGEFASASFTTGLVSCSAGPLVLLDATASGVTQELVVATTGVISDLDVSLRVTHSWVGDLIFRLENVDTGTVVTLMDRPGVPTSTFGCSSEDIDAVFDDSSVIPVETTCDPTPALGGVLQPQEPLAAFNGLSLAGTWRLFASDNAGGDDGQVEQWCLIPTLNEDTDGDSVPDAVDNCIEQANPGQADSNGDGIGNACDPDLNNDCIVNLIDLLLLRGAFLSSPGAANWDPSADFDSSNVVNLLDLLVLRSYFLGEPGPAASPNPSSGCIVP